MRLPDAHHVGFRLTGIEFSLDLHQVPALLLERREDVLTGRHGGPPTMEPGTSYYSLSLWSPVPGPRSLVPGPARSSSEGIPVAPSNKSGHGRVPGRASAGGVYAQRVADHPALPHP